MSKKPIEDGATPDIEHEDLDAGTAELVEALSGLPTEATPSRDLWPDIEAELEEHDDELNELVEALGSLPTEASPSRDLWSGIEARIAATRPEVTAPQPVMGAASATLGSTDRNWWNRRVSLPMALAASVALASLIGMGTWRLATSGQMATVAEAPGDATTSASGAVQMASDVADDLALPDYDAAVAALLETYEAGKNQLAPETIEVLEASLNAIDQAIAEARAAIEADPARDQVRRILQHNMNRKLDVLRQAAEAVQVST